MGVSDAARLGKTKGRASGQGSGLSKEGIVEITGELRQLLADVFALYLKTKNFHWHMSGPHFRDYHLLLDEQADQIFAMTDDVAERASDNQQVARLLRAAHAICDEHNDVATASLIENWIDETERRTWFLFET